MAAFALSIKSGQARCKGAGALFLRNTLHVRLDSSHSCCHQPHPATCTAVCPVTLVPATYFLTLVQSCGATHTHTYIYRAQCAQQRQNYRNSHPCLFFCLCLHERGSSSYIRRSRRGRMEPAASQPHSPAICFSGCSAPHPITSATKRVCAHFLQRAHAQGEQRQACGMGWVRRKPPMTLLEVRALHWE